MLSNNCRIIVKNCQRFVRYLSRICPTIVRANCQIVIGKISSSAAKPKGPKACACHALPCPTGKGPALACPAWPCTRPRAHRAQGLWLPLPALPALPCPCPALPVVLGPAPGHDCTCLPCLALPQAPQHTNPREPACPAYMPSPCLPCPACCA